jgi:predicted XRE-type DNA-binding protein
MAIKRLTFHGDSLDRLRDFPAEAEDRPARFGACGGTTAAAQGRIGMTKTRTFASVWDAIEDNPEDAATMTMRSDVMIAIADRVRSWNTTQARAARRLGITQPRLNNLLKGKINKFSLDTLAPLATRAGLKVKVRSAA